MKCFVVLTAVVAVIGSVQGNRMTMTTVKPEMCSQEIANMCPQFDDSAPSTSCFLSLPDPVFIADPENCAAYCECSDGYAYHFVCAEDTLYDEEISVCNWANMVDCGGRPILS